MRRLVLLVLVLAVAACGSSGRLSRGQLVKKADAACTRAHAAEEHVAPAGQVVRHLDDLIRIARQEHAELAALKPSKDDAATYRELLARVQKTIDLTVRARQAAAARSVAQYRLLVAAVLQSNAAAKAFAQGFGLKVCSASPA
jgi:hypothetical protein